jgi:purine-binding chemotaxis protein CheW
MLSPADSATLQYLTFVIAGEEYAVDILRVREILAFDFFTKIPRAPAFIRGVMNVRGSVIPVIDLAVKLGLPPAAVTKRTCLIVLDVQLRQESSVIGFLVDSVNEVVDLGAADIEDVPSFGTRLAGELLRGIGRVASRFVLVLDLDLVLTHLEQLTAAALAADQAAGGEAGQPSPARRTRKKRAGPDELQP